MPWADGRRARNLHGELIANTNSYLRTRQCQPLIVRQDDTFRKNTFNMQQRKLSNAPGNTWKEMKH
ncbi:hypothetical protein C5S30_03280 [ANME-1 cluster archaeon GoMg4]|nr:hypothetical protein [ANME-1 cluster archaeon GoMg4]